MHPDPVVIAHNGPPGCLVPMDMAKIAVLYAVFLQHLQNPFASHFPIYRRIMQKNYGDGAGQAVLAACSEALMRPTSRDTIRRSSGFFRIIQPAARSANGISFHQVGVVVQQADRIKPIFSQIVFDFGRAISEYQ